jgi:hypothetical protein
VFVDEKLVAVVVLSPDLEFLAVRAAGSLSVFDRFGDRLRSGAVIRWGEIFLRGGGKLVSAANVAEVVIAPFVFERTGSGGRIDLHLADGVNCMSCSHRSTIGISGAQSVLRLTANEIA